MAKIARAYQVSIDGGSRLFQFLGHPGSFPVHGVPENFRFESSALADCGVIEMTDRFRDYFLAHSIPARSSLRVSPYLLQSAASFEDVILACGMRPYADCHLLSLMLGDAWHDCTRSPLLTTRSNLFCMLNVFGEPCIVELWNHVGWYLDAFRLGDERKLFEPGSRLFSFPGVRGKQSA